MKISLIDKRALHNNKLSRIIIEMRDFDSSTIREYPWSPFLIVGGWLQESAFKSTTMLVFDIDNDPENEQLELSGALSRFKGYNHVIGTTRNHQKVKKTAAGREKPAVDRYRVILEIDRELTNIEEYKSAWSLAVDMFQLRKIVDPLRDAARYYLPCVDIISEKTDGRLFIVPKDLPDLFKPGRKSEKLDVRNTLLTRAAGLTGDLYKKTLNFIAGVPSHENWHSRFIAAAIDMKTQGYSKAQAAEVLKRASPEGELDQTDLEQLDDVYSKNRGKPAELRIAWPEQMENKHGEFIPVKTSVENLTHLICTMEKLQPRYNSRLQAIEKLPGVEFRDNDADKLYIKSMSYKLGVSKEFIYSLMSTIAHDNQFDPLKNNIEREKWDGRSRIPELLNTLTFSADVTDEDRKLYEVFMRRWLVGIVNKVYNPGSENNMLVFVGAQGVGKTRWFRRLAEPYPNGFIEAHINPEDKDSHLKLLKYFIWSVSELDTVTYSKDVGALKDFITKSEVRARPAYGRTEQSGSAITSFCASVNSRDFLHDTTGNRRYLVMLVDRANAEHKVDVGQLYAEAKVLMEAGERCWFNAEEIDAVNKYNERFMSRSDILEIFEENVSAGDQRLALRDIVKQLDIEIPNRAEQRAIRDWLTKRGIPVVSHSGVKKYCVTIKNAARPAQFGTRVAALKLGKELN